MKKTLPMSFVLVLLSLSVSVSFLSSASTEAVSVTSLSRLSEPERDTLFLAQAAPPAPTAAPEQRPAEPAKPAPAQETPAEAAPQPAPEETPAGTEAAPPQEVKPAEGGQPGVEAQPRQPAPSPRVAPRRDRGSRQPGQVGGPVSFFFDDADVYEVIQTVFGDILKVNYLIDQRVKGKVTFRTVTPIPREEVLPVIEIILRINGIGFVEEKGLYRIVPLTEVPKELLYAQVGKDPGKVAIELFTFRNLSLKESMSDLENAIGVSVQGGTARILPIWRLNALMVVTSTKEQMEYVRKWIEAFDSMFAYAVPKVMVYPLQNSKAAHVASMLQSILGGGGGGAAPSPAPAPTAPKPAAAPGAAAPAPAPTAPKTGTTAITPGGGGFLVSPDTKIFPDEINNTLVILATPVDYAFIEETLKKIDIPPRQVIIEALIVRVQLTDNLSFGFAWSFKSDINISGLKPFVNPVNLSGNSAINPGIVPGFTDPTGATVSVPSKGFTFVGTDPTGHVRAVITALSEESRAKVLAAPHLLVADNREARIQVGSQVPLSTSTTTTPLTGTATATVNTSTSTIQYKDIGIILKVKPQINDSGLVSIELAQEVSSIGANVKIAGQDFASIDKEEVTSNLVAQDGETIIIGGLIREDVTKSKDGIPVLSKIPILGHLFGNTTDNNTRSEIIVLLTPRVMKGLQEAGRVTSEYVDKYKSHTKDKEIDKFIEERGEKKSGGEQGPKDSDKK